jgi:hypothetical protein
MCWFLNYHRSRRFDAGSESMRDTCDAILNLSANMKLTEDQRAQPCDCGVEAGVWSLLERGLLV